MWIYTRFAAPPRPRHRREPRRRRGRDADIDTRDAAPPPAATRTCRRASRRYCDALTTLQDACPPFDDAEAKRVIAKELGAPLGSLFEDIGAAPIASASLGQVYVARANVEGETTKVAVKVQRPGVTETIALDLHLLRVAAGPLRAAFNLNTDLVGIVDAWGVRFVDELDYEREAGHARQFSTSIAETPLSGAVFAPEPLSQLTTRKVLTTTWVEGKRLDHVADASAEGEARRRKKVAALCGVAMNAYLTMMLETGVLHADPHPGNLIVEDDTGKLAILDWGLVTEMDPELRIARVGRADLLKSRRRRGRGYSAEAGRGDAEATT